MIDLNEIFNDSYERVTKDVEHFYSLFYRNFFNSSSEIKSKFEHVDMEKQNVILQKSILILISFSSTKKVNELLINLANAHKTRLKIAPYMYDLFIDALIITIRKTDPEFSHDVELAWRVTISPGIEFMKHYND